MKITIDTKEDSHEEIKKVIFLLKHLVGEKGDIYTNEMKHHADIFSENTGNMRTTASSESKEPDRGIFSMFGETAPQQDKQQTKDDITAQVFGSPDEKEKKEYIPEVEIIEY